MYPKPTWLGEELLARLARWCVESRQSGFKSTLSLISVMKYSAAYQALKEKYKDMVKVILGKGVWAPPPFKRGDAPDDSS